jgi:hypothetical protein
MSRALWWGDYHFSEEESARWAIGQLEFAIYRTSKEWRIFHKQAPEREGWHFEKGDPLPQESAEIERHVFDQTTESLTILPVLPDRDLVTSPWTQVHLSPGEKVTIYVGCPLWVRLQITKTGEVLEDLAIQRLSDTWFGPSVLEGDLCYGLHSHVVLEPGNLDAPHLYARTQVHVENQSSRRFILERIKLPVRYLSLFGAADGQLWTESLIATPEDNSELASIQIRAGAPLIAGEAQRIVSPREVSQPGLLMRVFSSLFQNESWEGDKP